MRQKINSKEEKKYENKKYENKKYENKKSDLINLIVSGSFWHDRMQ